MAENPEPPAPSPDSPEGRQSSTLPRRRNAASERQTQSSVQGLSEQLADLTNTVQVLAQHVVADITPSGDTATESPGRRVKKFTRRGTNDEGRVVSATGEDPGLGDADESDGGPAVSSFLPTDGRRTDAPEFNKNVAWPKAGQAETRFPARKKRPNKKVVLVFVQLVGILLLALGYLVGRSDSSGKTSAASDAGFPNNQPPSDDSAAFRVSERDLDTANKALHTARTGDPAVASKLFQDTLDQRLALPGVQYELARLALARNDRLEADIHLDRSSNLNEFVAATCYMRARFAGMMGNSKEVVRQFESAAHSEPFNGRYFFYWAEALRRMGKTQQAIDTLEMARDRAITPAEDALYLFKERVAKAESGHDEAFNVELDGHLKEEPAPSDWLMLAAAKSIAAGNNAGAAEFLRQAANGMSASTYNLWIKDFVFQTAIGDPTLTALVKRPPVPDSTDKDGPFLDPSVGPPDLMDPAIWPAGALGNAPR